MIVPKIEFSNNASRPALNQPLGNNGGDAGGFNFVPNMYVAIPLNKQFAFGLGVNAPFGLTTEYDDGWIGRYQALKSSITTINVNPAMSWKATPTFAVGAGVNYQYIKATLTQNVNYSGALLVRRGQRRHRPRIADLQRDLRGLARTRLEGDDQRQRRRVGLERRPRLGRDAGGATGRRVPLGDQVQRHRQRRLREPAADADARARRRRSPPPSPRCPPPSTSTRLYNRGVTSDITLPQIANVSMHWQIDPKWELMADAQYTGWSSIPELAFTASAPPALGPVPLNWDDTWKFAVGASYRYNDQWKARGGIAFDQTPVTNDPTPRLPDSDRWWFAIGGEYRWTPNWKFDAGFVYIQGDSAEFNRNEGSTRVAMACSTVRTTRA